MAKGRPITQTLEQRFNKKYIINEETNCWEWTAAKNNIGYGMFRWAQGIMRTAHRVSYELYKGPIPHGQVVCHTCDNPKCVNPDHLWTGTHKDNWEDMNKKGRAVVGIPQATRACKHCGKVAPGNLITRHHDDNCKHKQ